MTLVFENGLPALVALLREGRDYYRFAAGEVRDTEVALVFGYAADCRARLLEALVAARLLQHTSPAHQPPPLADGQGYALLRGQFDPAHPQAQAAALLQRERHLLRLVEAVFRTEGSLAARRALKDAYPHLHRTAVILQRLAQRRAAA